MGDTEPGVGLRTLGGLSLGGFRRVKPLLLLAYLALEGPTPRRHFRRLLWPEARQPESSLRVALHALHAAAPQAWSGGDLLVCGVPCDAVRLLEVQGEAALALYHGPFVQGVPPQEVSEEFLEWTETQRRRLALHVRAGALALAEQQPPEAAARLAERAYRLPGAPPPEVPELRRLLALTLPGSPLEAELRAELSSWSGQGRPLVPPTRSAGRMLGRAAELDRLLAWAGEAGTRWAVVSGPGGIGKSTLTRALLRELALLGRNVTLVDAEGAALPGDLLLRVALARAPGQAIRGTWVGLGPALGADPVILLDGLDELSDLPDLLDTLAADLPGARWVLTGRRHLGHTAQRATGGVLTLTLGGLDVPVPEAEWSEVAASSAAGLFVREAARVRRDFALTAGNARLIASLVRRLMGHPLALTLAASWLRVEALETVHARVLSHAAVLVSPDGDGDGRRGLLLVAQQSWALLTEAERHASLRLSICPDFDPADAPSLGVSDRVLDVLLEHSFLEAYLPGSERLRLYPALGGVLQVEALAHPELIRTAREIHAHHYLTRLGVLAPEDPTVDAERGNLQVAMRTALENGTLDAAAVNHLFAHYDRRGLYGGGTDVFAALADTAEDFDAPPDVQAAAQIACMWLAYRAGRLLDAQTLASRFLQGPLAGDPHSRMQVLNTLASVRGEQGQLRAANSLLRQASELARQLGDHGREVFYRMNQIAHLGFSGHTSEIVQELRTMRALLPGLSELMGLHVRRMMLAVEVYLPDADLSALATEARALQEAGHRTADLTLTLYGLLYMGRIALFQDRLRESELILTQLKRALPRTEVSEIETEIALLETGLRYAQGRAPQARRAARRALQLSARRNNPWELVELLLSAADDLQAGQSGELRGWLMAVATDENVHFKQRAWVWARLGNAGPALQVGTHTPLDIAALRAWLQEHLPGG
jgi:tetratricopeptide (TPR) repeat protein